MSLVNDALKRARAEAAEREGQPSKGRPSLPPPPRKRSPVPAWWISGLAAVAVLLVLVLRLNDDPAGRPVEPTAPVAKRAESQPQARVGETPPHTDLQNAVAESTESQGQPATEPAGRPARAGAPDDRAAAGPGSGAESSPPPPEPAPDPVPATAPPAGDTWYHVGSLVLPEGEILLSGIAWSPTAPSAVINGALLSIGDPVLSLRIVEISERTVVLEGPRGRYALQLGQPSEDGTSSTDPSQ